MTYAVPGIHPIYDIGAPAGCGNHTHGFTRYAAQDFAFEQTLKFADGLAQVGFEILKDDLYAQNVTEEFVTWRKSVGAV